MHCTWTARFSCWSITFARSHQLPACRLKTLKQKLGCFKSEDCGSEAYLSDVLAQQPRLLLCATGIFFARCDSCSYEAGVIKSRGSSAGSEVCRCRRWGCGWVWGRVGQRRGSWGRRTEDFRLAGLYGLHSSKKWIYKYPENLNAGRH